MMGLWLIFLVLIIGAIAYAQGWRPQAENNPFTPRGHTKSALDIARERYARGEISKEEFTQIRHDLSNG
jgi:putative membrane protein